MESFSEALKQERNLLAHEAKKKRIRRMRKAVGCIALSAATAAGVYGFGYLNKSGEHAIYPAIKPSHEFIDDDVKVVSWNVANKALRLVPQIEKLARQENPDVIALQEVNTSDAESLEYELPHWNVVYGLADTKQQPLDGGYGDVLMTRQEPEDVTSASIKGSSVLGYGEATMIGLGSDLADGVIHQKFSLKNSREKESENREVLALTIKARIGGKLSDVRILTGHISPRKRMSIQEEGNDAKLKEHNEQLNELLQIVQDNDKPDRPTIFCGDLNGAPNMVVRAFNNRRFTIRPPAGPTSVKDPVTIDYCANRGAGYGAPTKVLKNFKTDHYAIEGEWNMDDPSVNPPY